MINFDPIKMSDFFQLLKKILLGFTFILLIYIVVLFISNTSRGFDITDESYYILAAQSPNEIFSTIKHDGYYSGILFLLSGYKLSVFRLFGILTLISVSMVFAIELHKYILSKYNFYFNKWDSYLFIVPITLGCLSYYNLWLLTPSYNWLALVSVILVFISILKIINNKTLNYDRYISLDYILLSFSLSLSFMAKPTTALVIMIVSIMFAVYEWKNINLKKALLSVGTLTSFIVVMHVLFLDGGFSTYMTRLIEGMERLSLLGAGHMMSNRLSETLIIFQDFFFEGFYFLSIDDTYVYGSFVIIGILFLLRNKIDSLKLYIYFIFIITITYSYFMFTNATLNELNRIWLRFIELFLLFLSLTILLVLFIKEKWQFIKNILLLIPLLLIIAFGSLACKFGTNNYIIYALSDTLIFIVSAIIVMAFVVDKHLRMNIYTPVLSLISGIYIYTLIGHAYEHPYRLVESIALQNNKVELLGGLKVDKITKHYIEDLQAIALLHKEKEEKLSLIDMTGGSPGANVILEADFFGEQWLSGGYEGSNLYVERILRNYEGTQKLKNAWILTAPNGSRKLDLTILNKLGLNFPQGYKKIGTVTSSDRNEIQELWKPNNIQTIDERGQ